jgi:hypothetical protein
MQSLICTTKKLDYRLRCCSIKQSVRIPSPIKLTQCVLAVITIKYVMQMLKCREKFQLSIKISREFLSCSWQC